MSSSWACLVTLLPLRRSAVKRIRAPMMAYLKSGFGMKAILLLIQLVLVAALPPAARPWIRAAPLEPSADPFYTPPEGFESSAPGTILRSRSVPIPWLSAASSLSMSMGPTSCSTGRQTVKEIQRQQ